MVKVNEARRKILEFVQSLDSSAPEKPKRRGIPAGDVSAVIPDVKEEGRQIMAQDVNAALMDILGLLSEATSRVTQLLRGGAPLTVSSSSRVLTVAEPAGNGSESATASSLSALDRMQEYESGPKTAASMEEAPRKRGRRGKLNLSEDDLKKMYIDQDMTAKQIAEEFGVSPGTVAQRVMKLGLSKRGPSPAKGKKRK